MSSFNYQTPSIDYSFIAYNFDQMRMMIESVMRSQRETRDEMNDLKHSLLSYQFPHFTESSINSSRENPLINQTTKLNQSSPYFLPHNSDLQNDSTIKFLLSKVESLEQRVRNLSAKIAGGDDHKQKEERNSASEGKALAFGDVKQTPEFLKLKEENEMLKKDLNSLVDYNNKMKKMNETLVGKMKDIPKIESKFNELVESVALLTQENELLKKVVNLQNQLTGQTNPELAEALGENLENEGEKDEKQKEKDEEEEEKEKNDDELPKGINKEDFLNFLAEKLKEEMENKVKNDGDAGEKEEENKEEKEEVLEEQKNLKSNKDKNSTQDSEKNKLTPSKIFVYKPTKDGLLEFDVGNKEFKVLKEIKDYNQFYSDFTPESSITYNTLGGLFVLNSRNNYIYYFSTKKNSMSKLFNFRHKHLKGVLFLDRSTKNMYALGGEGNTVNETFSFEDQKITELPPFSSPRTGFTCCELDNKIYCLFGDYGDNEMCIEYLDLNDLSKGWIDVKYNNNTKVNSWVGMSVVNVNNILLLITGGLVNGEPSKEICVFNIEKSELFTIDKKIPELSQSPHLFYENALFCPFLEGACIAYINIDDKNVVLILDADLNTQLFENESKEKKEDKK